MFYDTQDTETSYPERCLETFLYNAHTKLHKTFTINTLSCA